MNKWCGVGRLTRDPEYKEVGNGKPNAKFTLAVDRRFKNKDGQKEADFIPIILWGRMAETARDYLAKGSQCGVVGRIQVRNYDAQDGSKRYVTEIIADELELMGKPVQKDTPLDDVLGDPDFTPIPNEKPRAGGKYGTRKAQPKQQSVADLDSDFNYMADDDEVPF